MLDYFTLPPANLINSSRTDSPDEIAPDDLFFSANMPASPESLPPDSPIMKKKSFKKKVKAQMSQMSKVLRRPSSASPSTRSTTTTDSPCCSVSWPSSSTHGTFLRGRRYHDILGPYMLPNDDMEMDRLLINHFLVKHCFNSNYSAPVSHLLMNKPLPSDPGTANDVLSGTAPLRKINSDAGHPKGKVWRGDDPLPLSRRSASLSVGQVQYAHSRSSFSSSCSEISTHSSPMANPAHEKSRVLDVACGSGVWVLEMAHEFPDTDFYGFDISCCYPHHIRPPNTFFRQHDITVAFPYPDDHFDYVHFQDAGLCFTEEATMGILNEITRVLKPGGFIEVRELNPHVHHAGPVTQALTSPVKLTHLPVAMNLDSKPMTQLKQRFHLAPFWIAHLQDQLASSGLVDIHQSVVNLPWHGRRSSNKDKEQQLQQHDCATSPRKEEQSVPDRCLTKMLHQFWRHRLIAFERIYVETGACSNSLDDLHNTFDSVLREMDANNSSCDYHVIWARKPLIPCSTLSSSPNDLLCAHIAHHTPIYHADPFPALSLDHSDMPRTLHSSHPMITIDRHHTFYTSIDAIDDHSIYEYTDGYID
ncbi:hypothetical protein BC940DRAFT_298127 [Gongronella butleri]|nr:hypothetical protein BC940DRAFT_298127 [Gongronella butleri]